MAAEPRGINPQASYSNKHAIMVSSIVRFVFIDERQNLGRVAATESIVSEVIMTQEHALAFAEEIIDILTSAPTAKPAFNNGPASQPQPVVIPDEG
jgi:hypothetical protein